MSDLEVISAGEISYESGRKLQETLVERVVSGGREAVVICSHPAVVTAGKRVTAEEFLEIELRFAGTGIKVLRVDRGGRLTYHGPGQVLIYPVINLRKRHLGVKRFIEATLGALAEVLTDYSVKTEIMLTPVEAGLWIGFDENARKVAAVGLRIVDGVINHGISLNVDVDLKVYSNFKPCNLLPAQIGNIFPLFSDSSKIYEIEENIIKKIKVLW